MHQLFALSPAPVRHCVRFGAGLLGLGVFLLLASLPALAQPAFQVNVTPAGPLDLPPGASTTLTASTSYPAFTVGTGFDRWVNATVVQSDGKILVGGKFTVYNGITRTGITRINLDGSLDTGFAPTGTGPTGGDVNNVAIQSDGKILVGGYFTAYNGIASTGIVRLNPNGSLDKSFASTGTGLTGGAGVRTIAIQLDGKILVGGNFTAYNGTPRNNIVRLNLDGTLDDTFTPTGTGLTGGDVLTLAIQSDGKILVGGSFTAYNGTTRTGLTRLTLDGRLDDTFTPTGTGLTGGDVNNIAIQSDGKILVGGSFNAYNGTTRTGVARLNLNGSLDISLAPTGTGLTGGGYVNTVAIQNDGKILVGGYFTAYNGIARNRIARLNPDGSLDMSFALTGTGLTGGDFWISGLPIQSDGKILVSGDFTAYNGGTCSGIARLTTTGALDDTPLAVAPNTVSYEWNPANTASGPGNNTQTVKVSGAYTAIATVATRSAVSNIVQVNIAPSVVITAAPNPLLATPIAAGSYNTITVNPNGIGKLTGDITVLDSVIVLPGATLRLGGFHILSGTTLSKFRLKAGATLSISDSAGITTSATSVYPGAVRTAIRTFEKDASYIYTGATSQVTGNGLPTQVRNLTDSTMQVGATLTLSAPTSVSQVLTLASANNLNLNGQLLTLLSSASGTALVVNSPTGGVTGGKATMQRYIDPAYNSGVGYRYYSPPVSGATVSSLATARFTPSITPPNVFTYDPTQLNTPSSSISSGLVPVTSLSAPLVVGSGYAVKLLGAEKVNFTGLLTTGDQPALTLTRSSPGTGPRAANAGWNLVGNPYPAPLDWSLVTENARPNLDAAIYTYVSTGPDSGFYNAYVNGWGGSPFVAAGQSFFVRVKDGLATGTLSLKNSQRGTSYAAQASFNRPTATNQGIELGIIDRPNGGGKPSVAVYMSSLATKVADRSTAAAFNAQTDAYRLPNLTTLEYSMSVTAPAPEDELAIKAIPPLTTNSTSSVAIPLTVRVPALGVGIATATYKIKVLKYQLNGIDAFLEDNGKLVSLGSETQYAFTFTATQAASPITGRFVLRFRSTTATATDAQAATLGIALYPNPAHEQVTVQIPPVPGAYDVRATLLNELGQVVRQQVAPLTTTGTRLLLDVKGLAPGVYAVRLQLGHDTLFQRLVIE